MVNIEDVIEKMQSKPASLFYGAGVSMSCGGPNNSQLFSSIKKEFTNGASNNFFDYLQEIIKFDNSNRQEIETVIRNNLSLISKQPEHEYLFSLPWRAILTTNYDHIPNLISTTLDGQRNIIPIVDPEDQIDQTRPDLYCIKLLGDTDYSYPNGGWMVLSSSDTRIASLRRSKFYQLFQNLSSSGYIIYLGYSFQDNIVFDLLQEMNYVLNRTPWESYAIIPHKPPQDIKRKMELLGITWVQGTLEEFISSAKKKFGKIPQSAPRLVHPFSVHNNSMKLERSTVSNIWNKFRLLDSNLLESQFKDPKKFFEGIDRSLYPYIANYDFPRNINTIFESHQNNSREFNPENYIKGISTPTGSISDNVLVCLTGIAGSGKTVIANRFAFNWYRRGNPVIYINPENIILDSIALIDLLDEIWEKYQVNVRELNLNNPPPLRFLIIADDCGSLLDQLIDLKTQLISLGKPADILLITRNSDVPIERLKQRPSIDCIYGVDDTISPDQHSDFINHFLNLEVVTGREILDANIRNNEINSSFFALIYSSIHEVQRPMRDIIKEEYQNLDEYSKIAYATVALLQSYSVSPYYSLILKSGNFESDQLQKEVKIGKLSGVIRFGSSDHELLTNNRIIADIISDLAFPSTDRIYSLLSKIISTITPGDKTEIDLLHLLLIDKIKKNGIGKQLGINQQLDLFNLALQKIKSRPLLLHLAILQMQSEDYSSASKTLDEALRSNINAISEPDEHILDQKGRVELRLAEKAIDEKIVDDAWNHLERAEDYFHGAQINPSSTPHPYQGCGRVYLTQASISPDEKTKWSYLLLALQECDYLESYRGENNTGIGSLKSEIIHQLNSEHLDESKIMKIMSRIGKGNGFAFLAEREIYNSHHMNALHLVNTGITQNPESLWLIRLKVSLIKKLFPTDTEYLRKTLNDSVHISDGRFDPFLAFELAKETFKSGDYSYAMSLFKEINKRTQKHKSRLKVLEENRWIENSNPKSFQGILTKLPQGSRYGKIRCTSLPLLQSELPVRTQDIRFQSPNKGERVTFSIIFRMIGPQASRVQRR